MTAAVIAGATVVGVVLALRLGLILNIVTVTGTSMEPTYRPGDRLLVRRWGLHHIQRGDVVIFVGSRPVSVLRPGDIVPPLSGRMIKRVTAMAGDALPRCQMPAHHDPSETVVPQSRLVVLGDNPRDSADSRVFGYVSQDQVIGVVMRRLT